MPTCRVAKIPYQTIEVNWITVHDAEQRQVIVEEPNDNDLWYGNLIRPKLDANIIAPDPDLYGARTSAIRQAGLDYAYAAEYDYIITVDDDCVLPPYWAEAHVTALRGLVPMVHNTVPGHVIRGIPVDHRLPVGISHGLWSGVLDYPAWYQLANSPGDVQIADTGWRPIAGPFPMCGMNVGFRREVLPAVYFQHRFLRHDDIFAGWFAQRVLGGKYGFVNGGAVVRHERASNAANNFTKEIPGDEVNGWLIRALWDADIPKKLDLANEIVWLALEIQVRLKQENKQGEAWRRLHEMCTDYVAWATRRENGR
jgi:GT2 family glycosyltransferase